jgi:hypothetical protein
MTYELNVETSQSKVGFTLILTHIRLSLENKYKLIQTAYCLNSKDYNLRLLSSFQ